MTGNKHIAVQKGALVRIRANYPRLSNAERKVSAFVSAHPEQIIHMTLVDLAKAAGVSDATALRFTRSIGFAGFNNMKMALVADLAVPVEAIFEEINDTDDISIITRKVCQANIQLLHDTVDTINNDTLAKAINIIRSVNRIFIYSVGTSAPLAEMLRSRLFRLSYHSIAITDAYLQIMQAAMLKKDDALIAISRSGEPSTLREAVVIARRNGVKTIAITCDAHSPIAQEAEYSITAVSKEIRSEIMASPVPLLSVIDVIYVVLVMQDKLKTVENQRIIWEAMAIFRK